MSELIQVPHLLFSPWQHWTARDRPSQELDVPVDFGLFGLYVLAAADVAPSQALDIAALPEEVVYIGMSSHVGRRLERFHSAVKRYRTACNDPQCKRLWHTTWHQGTSNWHSSQRSGIIAATQVAFYERALLAMYAARYGRLPKVNIK
ncbi:hypothetical protein [Paucibacter sp. M5-1]|uniref:hypothetical protein n=1 Tax=Paucibacter sp. M5-1 TaxID=3015998 RepID=UPI0022B8D032|nr:hypothetical protein [Paucibacter sp. M5-1]MCZ7884231.1 hypothetical protein [Paucibacter sp. M5-1]